jgi:hypothetical protein
VSCSARVLNRHYAFAAVGIHHSLSGVPNLARLPHL